MRRNMFAGNPLKRIVLMELMRELSEYGNCEVFREGMGEVGVVGGKEYWWDCELFQVGLKELGLVA